MSRPQQSSSLGQLDAAVPRLYAISLAIPQSFANSGFTLASPGFTLTM